MGGVTMDNHVEQICQAEVRLLLSCLMQLFNEHRRVYHECFLVSMGTEILLHEIQIECWHI